MTVVFLWSLADPLFSAPLLVQALSVSVAAILQNTYEVKNADAVLMQATAEELIQRALSLGIANYADMQSTLQTTNSLYSMTRFNYISNDGSNATSTVSNSTSAAILRIVALYAQLVGDNLVLGQAQASFLYSSFKLAVAVHPSHLNATLSLAGLASNSSVVTLVPRNEQASTESQALSLIESLPR